MNIIRLTKQLAISGCIGHQSDMERLVHEGFTYIIAFFHDNDRCHENGPDAEVSWARTHNVRLHRINLEDDRMPWTPQLLESALDFALGALSGQTHKLLIHCMAGRARSPSLAYAVLRCLGYGKGIEYQIAATIGKDKLPRCYTCSIDAYLSGVLVPRRRYCRKLGGCLKASWMNDSGCSAKESSRYLLYEGNVPADYSYANLNDAGKVAFRYWDWRSQFGQPNDPMEYQRVVLATGDRRGMTVGCRNPRTGTVELFFDQPDEMV